ncbi:PEP-CTERM putative exosortase interaction domain-containing protein [Burkholderiales bacterium JOSHI_001]|nr:PEP-CTERM putative exosortase interaction domain-containing protein [Burkholderiales bacterium JOSHI_001]
MFKSIRRAPGALALLACAAGLAMSPAQAQTTAFVDFESTPGLAQGPSIYVAVPAMQVINVPNIATFSGGVVLGLATFFPAISFASSPNVYGTADFGNGLSPTLTIDINPNYLTTEVSFALFNGETFAQTYTARAFNGATQVAAQTLTSVAPNFNSGYGVIDLIAAGGITQVTIDADGAPAAFDFLIDDVAFNQALTNVITTPLPPVVQAPVQPVEVQLDNLDVVVLDTDGQRRKRKQKGKGTVQVDFGEDLSNIQSEVLLFDPITTPVPEPSSTGLMLLGLAGMGVLLRRRRID